MDHQLIVRSISRATRHRMRYFITITRMDDPSFDEQTGAAVATVTRIMYHGPARVYQATGPVTYEVGDQQEYFSRSVVEIPIDTCEPQRDDVISVDSGPDPMMVGRRFQVLDVETGGQWPAIRRLSVIGMQAYPNWSA